MSKYIAIFVSIFILIFLVFLNDFKDKYSQFFYVASKNANTLNVQTKGSFSLFKTKGQYDFGNYNETGPTNIYTSNNEIYAKIVPEYYYSNKIYSLNDNEIQALLFIEDKDFIYRRITVSIKGILRSLYNIHIQNEVSGASGITQQLVKNLLLEDNSRNLLRKYKELFISYYLEYNYSKIDILNEYLNKISYGKNIFGIQKAGEIYLGKTDDLSIEESFLLNSLLKKPTYFLDNQAELKQRASYYLSLYLKDKNYSLGQINLSRKYLDQLEIKYESKNERFGHNNYLVDQFLNVGGSESIVLNYDITLEKEKEITSSIDAISNDMCGKYNACDIGIMVYGKDNKIKYLYGGDYSKSQVNIINSRLEVGSTLKPFIYLKYFEKYGFQNQVPNSKICVGEYCPNNWDLSSSNSVSLSRALNLSYNIPIIHIVKNTLGINIINKLFADLGLYGKEINNPNYSFLFGTENIRFFDLVKSYSIFLHDGILQDFNYTDTFDSEKIIFSNNQDIKKVAEVLKGNGYFPDLSIKTGTTTGFKDHYIIGFNDSYVFGIWMGNKNGDKTLPGDYSLAKGREIVEVLKKHILD